MDTITLVEAQIEDGQRLLDRLDEGGFVVRAACWVKPVDDDRWTLYIATPAVDEKGSIWTYGEVYRVLRSLEDACIRGPEISLVGEKHPIVREVDERQQRFPGRTPPQSQRSFVDGLAIEELYAYTLGKVEVTIYGMVFQGEPMGGLHLALEPHNPDSRMVVGIGKQSREYLGRTGIDWVVAAPEGATLERDELGRMTLAWDMHGRRMKSDANDVWSYAKLGMHGFRFRREPS